jgi:hypothetical protein
MSNLETISFDNFYFKFRHLSIGVEGETGLLPRSTTMIEHRPFNQLASADHGWLKARHHFSFGEFADPSRMGWGTLRVWNDDEIAANTGFPPLAILGRDRACSAARADMDPTEGP